MSRFSRKYCRSLIIRSFSVFAMIVLFMNNADAEEGWYSLQAFKDQIIQSISDAQKLNDKPPYFIIKQIDISLKGVKSDSAGGGISIPIFGKAVDLGGEATSSTNETFEVALIPADTIVVGGDGPKIDLAGLLADVKTVFRSKKKKDAMLLIKEMKYEKIWTLQYSGSGGINFIIAKADLKISKEKQQLIRFTLCETLNLRNCVQQ